MNLRENCGVFGAYTTDQEVFPFLYWGMLAARENISLLVNLLQRYFKMVEYMQMHGSGFGTYR